MDIHTSCYVILMTHYEVKNVFGFIHLQGIVPAIKCLHYCLLSGVSFLCALLLTAVTGNNEALTRHYLWYRRIYANSSNTLASSDCYNNSIKANILNEFKYPFSVKHAGRCYINSSAESSSIPINRINFIEPETQFPYSLLAHIYCLLHR